MNKPKEADQCMVCRTVVGETEFGPHGAGCAHIHCGYSSDFDLLEFKGFVCDKCLEYLVKNRFFPQYRERGLGGPDHMIPFKPIEEYFEYLKYCWAMREKTEDGRKVNQDLLEKRDGKKLWEQ